MGTLTRSLIHSTYVRGIKPLLFTAHPDIVHAKTVILGTFIQKNPAALSLVKASMAYTDDRLAQSIHGIRFENPVGLSAGFDKGVELVPLMQSVGFGFVTSGSVTGNFCEGNEKPWFHRLPKEKSLVVNVGLANPGSYRVAKRLQTDKKTAARKVPLMISVARTNDREHSTDREGIEDYVQALRNLASYPNLFEINISCPNTYGGEPFTEPGRLEKLLHAIDLLKLQQPVFVKMPSHLGWPELDTLLAVIERHAIQGVTICNLRKNRDGVAIDDSVKGNLSGKPVQERSDELIEETYKKYGKRLTIIGVGGIFTADDAYRKITRGASIVALVTGMIFEGPSIVGSINEGIVQRLKEDGFTNIRQAVGSGVK